MPIYAYRCEQCGHSQDVMQKLSDAPLTVCPACGADGFRKQLTAPAFQLKGTGWYVTDFRDNGKAKAGKPDEGAAAGGETKADGASSDKAPAAAPAASSAGSTAAAKPADAPAKTGSKTTVGTGSD